MDVCSSTTLNLLSLGSSLGTAAHLMRGPTERLRQVPCHTALLLSEVFIFSSAHEMNWCPNRLCKCKSLEEGCGGEELAILRWLCHCYWHLVDKLTIAWYWSLCSNVLYVNPSKQIPSILSFLKLCSGEPPENIHRKAMAEARNTH